jgi:hypothetical protein
MTKQELLKPHLLDCIARLQSFIEVGAPAVVIGHEAFNVLATTLAVYGTVAGAGLISHIRDTNLHSRGICTNEDCVECIERPGVDICEKCCVELGIGDDDDMLVESNSPHQKTLLAQDAEYDNRGVKSTNGKQVTFEVDRSRGGE